LRTIGVVTVGRSDYGIYGSLLRALMADPEVELRLYVTGMHLAPAFGETVSMIEADGYPITERIETLLSSDSPEGVAKAMGLGLLGFSQAFARSRPDVLVVLGDRFDMYPAALAALPFRIPVAHVHGGELTFGALDDALRHSMTKLSHLHFVATETYARRVVQLGEEPWRTVVSGAPALDNLGRQPHLQAQEIEKRFGVSLKTPPLLVTFHPVTLEYANTEEHVAELLAALEEAALPAIFTAPNADTAGRIVRAMVEAYVTSHDHAWLVESFGQDAYFGLLSLVAAMVGNSSSGLIEAASFSLPVVNIGNRQAGRVRGANVIDVGHARTAILAGIRHALAPEFRTAIRLSGNPYRASKGTAAAIIVERLKTVALDDRLLVKQFHDLDGHSS
jgi:UDP-hydrolysing UDP-N-acetyl-D-glucosamine 2-epimerase